MLMYLHVIAVDVYFEDIYLVFISAGLCSLLTVSSKLGLHIHDCTSNVPVYTVLTLSYTGGGGGWWGQKVVMLISVVENFGETQWLFLKFSADFFLAKKLIGARSVAMVMDLSKILFGCFFFIHIFCCIFNVFHFICAYCQSRRYNFIISH